jgi:hypothetical protein
MDLSFLESLEIVGDEVNDIHGLYIIWQTASHFTQIVYLVAGGSELAGVLLCSVPFSITFYSP